MWTWGHPGSLEKSVFFQKLQPYCGLDTRQSPLYCLQAEHLPVILCPWAFPRTSWAWSLYLSPNSSLLTLIIAKLVLPKCLSLFITITLVQATSPGRDQLEQPPGLPEARVSFSKCHVQGLPPSQTSALVSQCSLTCLASIIRSLLT